MTAWEETTTSAGESSISLSAVDENPPAKLARAIDYLRNCCLVGGCGVWIGFSVWSIVLLALGLPRPPSWPLVLGFVLFFGFFPVALLRSSLERVVRARATRRFVMTCSPSHFRAGFDGHSRAFEMKVDEIDRFETWAAHLTVARNDGTKYQLPAITDPEIRAKLVERLGEMLDQARIGARIRVATRGDYRGHDGRVGKSVDESTDDSSPLEKREG
ncbi:MAG TPA: hypothetical protein VH054_09715, partial [Polyangiaceae bacterium]|nr:hypothetical protein [Polyangiaceae bacterium]